MTSEPPVLKSLTVERFRGILERHTVLLDASVVIIAGPNGSGKTSLFDAIQWLMLGQIKRLAALTTRRSGDYIVSSFAPDGERAVVSAELRVQDKHIVIRREGTARENMLSWSEGAEILTDRQAEERLCKTLLGDSELSLEDTMLTSGLLQQDVVRAVLEDQPKDRYRHMAAMLGLTEVAGFEDQAKARSEMTRKEASRLRDEHQQAELGLSRERGGLERLEQRILAQPEFQSARGALQSRLETSDALRIESLPTSAPDAVALGQWARRVRNEASELLRDDEELSLPDPAFETFDLAQLEQLRPREVQFQAELETARAALSEVEKRHAAAQERASQLSELAALALPLLGDHCPVCEQEIERPRVAAHLHGLVGGDGDDLATLRSDLQQATDEVDRLGRARQMVSDERMQLEALRQDAEKLTAHREGWRTRCKELSEAAGDQASLELVRSVASGNREGLEELTDAMDLVAGVADELGALLGASGLSDEVERQRRKVSQLERAVLESKSTAAEQSAHAAEAKTVATAATEAVAGVTRKRFATLQPLLDDIFRRLDPHPVFRTLGFDLDVAYRSGVADPFVRDPEQGVIGDPLLVFSSSQANVAALTYFLALSWAAGTQALPFLLLDDPLQSMDDVNVLGFSDLCRHLRDRRQLVLSTHERRLALLLERKLLPRGPDERTRVINFTGWNRNGPTIAEEEIAGPTAANFLIAAE